mgnify:CR=1 FL=1
MSLGVTPGITRLVYYRLRVLDADPRRPARRGGRGRVAVLGCGRGHDARAFAARGHEVIGYDFAEEDPPDSIERRRGAEWLIRLTREP